MGADSTGVRSGADEFVGSAPGLYLHIPFCSAVCPYCDFAVMVGGARRREIFVEALLAEIGLWEGSQEVAQGFETVYFGGGTPSALGVGELERIVGALGKLRTAGAWVLFEANPEDVNAESVAGWRGLGVRTLSLGVQSFDEGALGFLGRRHGAAEGRRAVEVARAAGFDTLSVDLIYGLPGQDAGGWRRDLETAVALAPDHISCYQLTVHEGTPFGVRRARGELVELAEGGQAELFALTHRFLADAGYPAYEVSNFARGPEHRSRHNVKYWDHTPYLGLGPSAHSFGGIGGGGEDDSGARGAGDGMGGDAVGVGARRWWNERRLAGYRGRLDHGERPVAGEERLGRRELALERLMLALRTPAGLDLGRFQERYGVELAAANRTLLDRLGRDGQVEFDGRRLRPTLRGLAVADSLAAAFEV